MVVSCGSGAASITSNIITGLVDSLLANALVVLSPTAEDGKIEVRISIYSLYANGYWRRDHTIGPGDGFNYFVTYISVPTILWWTPFTGNKGSIKKCGPFECHFTENRKFQHHPSTKAIMFYGSNLNYMDLPLPRNGLNVSWALLHEESPKNRPILLHGKFLSLFNYSSTFSRKSHLPLTLQFLGSFKDLVGTTYFMATDLKDKLLSELAPVVYVHSDCGTPSRRDEYVQELMKHIRVDSYGACLNNKKLPREISSMTNMDDERFFKIVAQYKFTLAFENAFCEDYITEKLWRPLTLGSVPIYMGSPSVRDWLPNRNSAILASDFESPEDLAKYLTEVGRDKGKYESFLRHKLGPTDGRVSNGFLKEALASWKWGIDPVRGSFVDHFECYVCRSVHDHVSQKSVVSEGHYKCPPPVNPLTGRADEDDWWYDVIWYRGKCEATTVRKFVDEGKTPYTPGEFRQDEDDHLNFVETDDEDSEIDEDPQCFVCGSPITNTVRNGFSIQSVIGGVTLNLALASGLTSFPASYPTAGFCGLCFYKDPDCGGVPSDTREGTETSARHKAEEGSLSSKDK
uniref:Fucosyltransferase n=1 Tax=Timema genevievae TaxID=629358 RepID=A0A7R9PH76_TIMGE|nr:unnamed protein product [Timema genevievae]